MRRNLQQMNRLNKRSEVLNFVTIKQKLQQKKLMGNQICCQQTTAQQFKEQIIYNSTNSNIQEEPQYPPTGIDYTSIATQRISPQIRAVLQHHRPFEAEFSQQDQIRFQMYGNQLYEGPIDIINRPCKIGKMYKENGAYFIGNFVSGKAQGPCFYVMSDGSYYRGQMRNNIAECDSGDYVSKNFEYSGGFQNNMFQGRGRERTPEHNYSFEGIYQNNKKKQGIMKWTVNNQEYLFEGFLDVNGKYTGKGSLTDPQGKYEGQFLNGQKHGYGIYYYKSQLRYEGYYAHNKKQGEGKLFNNDNTIAYKGIFKNGMPNGKGIATAKNGSEFQTEWVDGIDVRLL